MKAKTYAKTTPKRERLVNFRNLTDKSSILSQNLGPKTSTNEIFRVLRHPKWLLEASRQCQEGVRGSQGELGAAKQESQRLPGDAFGLPRGCLGRLWDLPGRPPGAILEQILIPNSMILQQTCLKPFFLKFSS